MEFAGNQDRCVMHGILEGRCGFTLPLGLVGRLDYNNDMGYLVSLLIAQSKMNSDSVCLAAASSFHWPGSSDEGGSARKFLENKVDLVALRHNVEAQPNRLETTRQFSLPDSS